MPTTPTMVPRVGFAPAANTESAAAGELIEACAMVGASTLPDAAKSHPRMTLQTTQKAIMRNTPATGCPG